jgi:ATP-binding cassette subfamily B protein
MGPADVGPQRPVGKGFRTWRTKGAWENWKAFGRCLPYLRPYKTLYILTILFTLLGAVIALAEPWPLAVLVDSVLGNHGPPGILRLFIGSPDRYVLLGVVVAAGFLITVSGHGLTVVNEYVSTKLDQNMVLDLRSELFQHSQRLSLTFHDERFTGALMAMINMQAAAVGQIVMAFPPIIQNMLTLIGMFTIAMFIDWQVALVSLIAVPFIYYALGLYGTRIVPRVRHVMSLEWGSLSIVYEALAMLRVIVSFGRESYEFRRFRSQGQTAVNARVTLTVRQTIFTLCVTAATAAGTALVLGFGALHVINGQISTGELLVLLSYIASVYVPLESIGNVVGELHQQFVFLNVVMSLLDEEPEVKEAPDAVDIGRSKGQLTLDNVTFTYQGRENTIRNICFEGTPGQRIAVVGPTGAGKTTLSNLLVRFYDPNEGAILIDGIDIRKLKLKSLREQVSLVLQEPMLFSGSIAENIRYGRLEATMDEIVEAAKRANSHDFIEALPQGYQTELGEGGHQLSGGERQRICVARAFIKDAPILILDEPTSSIDSKTESVILDALDELMQGRTSIMIAHRLSTVRDADVILVMNHGELVEHGPHEELLARGGLYSQLYLAQTQMGRRAKEGAIDDHEIIESLTKVLGERAHAETHPQAAPQTEDEAEPVGADADGHGPGVEANGHEPDVESDGHEPVPDGEPERSLPPTVEPAAARLGLEGNGAKLSHRNGHGRVTAKLPLQRNDVSCDICGRVLLKGEIAQPFSTPPGIRKGNGREDLNQDAILAISRFHNREFERRMVCELCWPIAEDAGWRPIPTAGGLQ